MTGTCPEQVFTVVTVLSSSVVVTVTSASVVVVPSKDVAVTVSVRVPPRKNVDTEPVEVNDEKVTDGPP